MEPITLLMSSYSAIKAGVTAGKEIHSLAKHIGSMFDAIDDIRNDHNKAKSNPLRSANEEAMETFIAKKKAEDLEHNLRQIVIATRGYNGWSELQKLRADIRNQRAEDLKQRKKARAETIENLWTAVAILLGITIFGGIIFGGLWFARQRGIV
jgi:CHASE3 domain sensor protein